MGYTPEQKELLDAMQIMIDNTLASRNTEIYMCIVKNHFSNSRCEITLNNRIHNVQYYGDAPTIGQQYRVFLPSGRMSQAFIITGGSEGGTGLPGRDGYSIEYQWNGTELGIKREDEVGYQYQDLKGEQGPKGDKGDPGDPGPKGDTGATGPAGPKGDTGGTGPQGPKGDKGADGQPGTDGQDGITPTIGGNGNWYLGDTDTGKPSRGEMGPQGPQGETGAIGPQGLKGDKGETGPQGPQGEIGPTGPTGPQGPAGADGLGVPVPADGDAGKVPVVQSDMSYSLVDVSLAIKPASISVTLPASNWDSSAKTQTVTVPGILADETKQLITPTPALAYQTAYYEAGIRCTNQAADSLTFTAETVPTEDLTIYVTIQEVSVA